MQLCDQGAWCHHPVGVFDEFGDLAPERAIVRDIEVDPDPAAPTDVGRNEEALRIGLDQRLLGAGGSMTPETEPIIAIGGRRR